MIIHKRNHKNFINDIKAKKEEWFELEDNSELAKKYKKYYPNIKIIFKENGKIEDIVEDKKDEKEINEKIRVIDEELKEIELMGVNIHIENIVEAGDLFEKLNSSTKELIERKRELRSERLKLSNSLNELNKN